MDLSRYRGIGQFGPAYLAMLEHETHAPGSVDRVLLERMLRLCPETAAYLYREFTPVVVRYRKGTRPFLEHCLEEIVTGSASAEEQIDEIATFTARLGEAIGGGLDAMRFGGTEEEIIERGSSWCTDVARVASVLCQVAGFPARVLSLADTDQAYSGHSIIEVHRSDVWGAIDPTTAVTYRHPGGKPASAWELMRGPQLIEAHWRAPSTEYTRIGQFKRTAVSNYFVWEWSKYDYTLSSINSYCRSILEMSARGWPGGLRWLHDEDGS